VRLLELCLEVVEQVVHPEVRNSCPAGSFDGVHNFTRTECVREDDGVGGTMLS
jgi:hypothetical protein